ncbi:MAG: hypothetical protein IJA23_04925 [Clostridia bacterium]|nr:hypothetical protein [Clostridia bacterium]
MSSYANPSKFLRKSQGTRPYFDIKTTFYNSHPEKDSDEFWTEGFSHEHVKYIIDLCNTTGIPAELTIKIKLDSNNVFDTISFPILPTLTTYNLTDGFATTKQAYYANAEMTKAATFDAVKKHKRDFAALVQEHEDLIKEYVRMELIKNYANLSKSPSAASQTTANYIKNSTIVKEKYDLDKCDFSDVQAVKLPNSSHPDFEALLYSYAKKYAAANRQNNKISVVYGFDTTFVGLEKPQSESKIESYAKSLSSLSDFRRKVEFSYTFMDEYKRRKEKPYTDSAPLLPMPESFDPSAFQPQ